MDGNTDTVRRATDAHHDALMAVCALCGEDWRAPLRARDAEGLQAALRDCSAHGCRTVRRLPAHEDRPERDVVIVTASVAQVCTCPLAVDSLYAERFGDPETVAAEAMPGTRTAVAA
jgi:hypothetical protein